MQRPEEVDTQVDEGNQQSSEYSQHGTVAGAHVAIVNGAADSLAQEFAAGTSKYTFLAAGVQMAFKDGSSCNMNFGRAIDAKPVV